MQRLDFRLRAFARDARPQAAEHADALIPVLRKLLTIGRDQRPHVRSGRIEGEPFRHHAGDGARAIADGETAADDIGRRQQRASPESVSQHDGASLAEIGRLERAAHRGCDTEHREEIRAHRNREHDLRAAVASQNLFAGCPGRRRDPLEAPAAAPPVLEIVVGRKDLRKVPVRDMAVPDRDDPIGTGVRQGSQENRFDDAEHRGCGANPEGEREDGDDRKTRIPAPRPDRVSTIAAEI